MSWADIAKSSFPQKPSPSSIEVRYNVTNDDKPVDSKYDDGIPRHKEYTPDPADEFIMTNEGPMALRYKAPKWWDGEWIDYHKNDALTAFKRCLPSSIQQIIEWSYTLRKYHKVLKFDFVKFGRDLKYQYERYNGDKKALKKLYFNYNPESKGDYMYDYDRSDEYDARYAMIFGDRQATVVHYLFGLIDGSRFSALIQKVEVSNKNKIRRNVLKMLKLLVVHDIIDVDDPLHAHTFGVSVYDQIKYLLYYINDEHSSEQVMNLVIDLVVMCMKKRPVASEDAVMRIYVKNDEEPNPGWFSSETYCLNMSDIETVTPISWGYLNEKWATNRKMCNQHAVIEKLLLRGVQPLQFIDGSFGEKTIPWDAAFIRRLLAKENVIEAKDSGKSMPIAALALCAPLTLTPYICRVRGKLKTAISAGLLQGKYIESESLSDDVASIVSFYLMEDFEESYHKSSLEKNVNVKALVLLNHLLHFQMDDVFMQEFAEKYSDSDFLHYVVSNHLYSLSRLLGSCRSVEFVRMFMDTYSKEHEYPLENGVYLIVDTMRYQQSEWSGANVRKHWKRLVRYFVKLYGDKFQHGNPQSIGSESEAEV